MKREEAIARGLEVHDIKHSMARRSLWHNYNNKGTYMLTLVVEGRAPLLGRLTETNGVPYVEPSELGTTIFNVETQKISLYYPMVEVWKVCLMPDHIHMIVRVKEALPKGKHLGNVVSGFKAGCSMAWWRLSNGGRAGETAGTNAITTATGVANVTAAVPVGSPTATMRPVLFEKGYNDKILRHEGQLERWKAYLEDNPRRLLIKKRNPQLFTVLRGIEVAGRRCQAIGNNFLLDVPDKVAVIVHRRYTDEENERLKNEWLACGERGGVLVSAAIAPKEKAVLREAMNRGYRIILLRENGFPPLYKPSGESFDACYRGQLLQISPWDYHMERKVITRAQCLELNEMSEKIAHNTKT